MSLRLDRRQGQAITIPGDVPEEDVIVRVISIGRDDFGVPSVRLEIKAHPEQGIFRQEFWRRLEREGAADGRSRRG
jgi:sRNA-binding carbon storage regulator CsrA